MFPPQLLIKMVILVGLSIVFVCDAYDGCTVCFGCNGLCEHSPEQVLIGGVVPTVLKQVLTTTNTEAPTYAQSSARHSQQGNRIKSREGGGEVLRVQKVSLVCVYHHPPKTRRWLSKLLLRA